jgi:hypothetical protein
MTTEKISPVVTLFVKGVIEIAPGTTKLPAGTVCLKAAVLPGAPKLPPGTVAVQAVTLLGPESEKLGKYAVEQLQLSENETPPDGSVVVAVSSIPETEEKFVEVIDVTEELRTGWENIMLGTPVPELPPGLSGKQRKFGIRIPVIPPVIIPKKRGGY